MNIPLYQVDAFAGKLFSGNPAAVCPLDQFLSDDLMQSIAAENNLSETTFFVKNKEGFEIRWFTPTSEVKLCGHATLATAYVIFNFFETSLDRIMFSSKSGPLYVRKIDPDHVELNFPAIFPEKTAMIESLVSGLGLEPSSLYRSDQDYLAIFENQDQIMSIQPDFDKLTELDLRGVIISSPSDNKDYDFVSRFFVPKCGVLEDPVTGSAHCVLTPYWTSSLQKSKLKAKQGSKRGGELHCELVENRVHLTGKVVPYLKGEIQVA